MRHNYPPFTMADGDTLSSRGRGERKQGEIRMGAVVNRRGRERRHPDDFLTIITRGSLLHYAGQLRGWTWIRVLENEASSTRGEFDDERGRLLPSPIFFPSVYLFGYLFVLKGWLEENRSTIEFERNFLNIVEISCNNCIRKKCLRYKIGFELIIIT